MFILSAASNESIRVIILTSFIRFLTFAVNSINYLKKLMSSYSGYKMLKTTLTLIIEVKSSKLTVMKLIFTFDFQKTITSIIKILQLYKSGSMRY